MNSVEDLTDTIKPKSDQLNADDLLVSPMTVTIKDVRAGSADQPVWIDIEGQQPYKPCKTMRRVMISAWGVNGKKWVGKSMTLFCDPSVKWGGVAIGGIRISHMSHIEGTINMMLTATRGKKSNHTIKPLVVDDHSKIIQKYINTGDGDPKSALWVTLNAIQQEAINNHFQSKMTQKNNFSGH